MNARVDTLLMSSYSQRKQEIQILVSVATLVDAMT